MSKTALIILAEGFEEVEAITPIDLLRRAGIEVHVAGLTSLKVHAARGTVVVAEKLLEDCVPLFDAIILPGGAKGTDNLKNSNTVINLLQRYFKEGKICASICAAALVLDKAGILKNHVFTCFPGIEKGIFNGTWSSDSVVSDRTIITSRAVGTAIPFALHLITRLADTATAQKVAESIVFPWKPV
jgi:4-methyl-5(b-hydroxyethyl)-thiazole monophosphate biosynthesis